MKVIEITAEEGETSNIITDLINSAIDKNELKNKVAAFCADNAKVDFGGETRGGRENVFFKMNQSYPHLIGINCAAHITHNALKKACDSWPIEVQMIV